MSFLVSRLCRKWSHELFSLISCSGLLISASCGHSNTNESPPSEGKAETQSLIGSVFAPDPMAILAETPITPFQVTPARDCLARHVHEAIELNETRFPLYAKVSEQRSVAVSEKLLNSERKVLEVAKLLDGPARFWQERGVPVGCADFVPMAGAAKFQERKEKPIQRYSRLAHSELLALIARVKWAVLQSDSLKVELLHKEIMALSGQKDFHCMKRHILESIARSSFLLPLYDEWSVNRKLPSPRPVIMTYVNAQIATLILANDIDNLAAPMQEEGIPIVCNDVPFIPYGPLSE